MIYLFEVQMFSVIILPIMFYIQFFLFTENKSSPNKMDFPVIYTG